MNKISNVFCTGAIALAASTGLLFVTSSFNRAIAQSVPSSMPEVVAQTAQRGDRPGDARDRRDDPSILEPTGPNEVEEAFEDGAPVTFSLRLNTELFDVGGDLVEFMVPIRYNPTDRLAMEAVPVVKYFPESAEENFDYGFKFAVEYRL